MTLIQKTFESLKKRNEGTLIAYVTAGDPEPQQTPKIVEALIKGGADIVELGVPFSDPIADGPTIQAATVRALKAGTKPRMVIEIAREIREKHSVPVVLMTYYNPIFRMGLNSFFTSARQCHVDGVVVPDLPVEEAQEYKRVSESCGVDTIFIATPATSVQRLRRIIGYTSGFLYLVSVSGVTGARKRVQDSTVRQIEKFVPYTEGKIPLAVGFGISQPEHVEAVIRSGADGAIVGSAFVDIIQRNHGNIQKMLDDIEQYTRKLKAATRQARTNS